MGVGALASTKDGYGCRLLSDDDTRIYLPPPKCKHSTTTVEVHKPEGGAVKKKNLKKRASKKLPVIESQSSSSEIEINVKSEPKKSPSYMIVNFNSSKNTQN